MEFQITEAVELIKSLAEAENLTLDAALRTFVAEADLDLESAALLKGELFETYTLEEMASDSLSSALYGVFVSRDAEELQEVDTKETQEGTKYKVRVQDRASGSSYVRYATREKIAELRANPNISSVEITSHGETGADDKGQRTAAAKAGKDYDGDGKRESSSKEHAGVVHNAIQRAKGGTPDGKDTRKEEVEIEEGMHRDAKTGEVTDKAEVGKTYYPNMPKRKSSVALRKEKEAKKKVEEGVDFKGARRVDDARKKEQDEKDKKSPSSKHYRLAMGKFRPGASQKERAEGGRDVMREKGTSPKKNGKKMFEAYLAARAELQEMKHRDAKTGEVVDKAEVGKIYYPEGPRQKSSVAKRKEAEAKKKVSEGLDMWKPDGDAGTHDKNAKMRGQEDAKKAQKTPYLPPISSLKKKKTQKEEWKPDPVEKRQRKAEKLAKDEAIESGRRPRDRDESKIDKLYKRRQAVQSKTKMRKEEFVYEADVYDSGRENQSQRDKVNSGKKIDGKGVDNSTRVKLMPTMEAVVTESGMSKAEVLIRGSEVNEALRTKIHEFRATLDEECCPKCGTPECTCESKDEKPKKKKAKLDEAGMPILEYSRNNARPGPSPERINPGKDPEGEPGHMNPKGEPKRWKESGAAPGDRRPNAKKDKSLPNENGTVPNGSGV